jgi:hypothetical protein
LCELIRILRQTGFDTDSITQRNSKDVNRVGHNGWVRPRTDLIEDGAIRGVYDLPRLSRPRYL